ncbi:unnamed protein product [Fraxinus pennsylvanica]|uniref:MACPF domain-containing protein n=1 Tax=Fraxinus pennsylvanica TaxID=56036 RepID=A0AAD1Z7I5_9LAMI|nr:unnamed protein product [Fraxinus pennsylvanica]
MDGLQFSTSSVQAQVNRLDFIAGNLPTSLSPSQIRYCKCGMSHNPDDVMVQCEGCKGWFIEKFGMHIIVGIKMGGKDVVFMKQQHSSSLRQVDVQQILIMMADKRFYKQMNNKEWIQSKY